MTTLILSEGQYHRSAGGSVTQVYAMQSVPPAVAGGLPDLMALTPQVSHISNAHKMRS
jgi:hypothetical protein